jgi:hypothetical protein
MADANGNYDVISYRNKNNFCTTGAEVKVGEMYEFNP